MREMGSPSTKNVTVTLTEGVLSTTAAIERVQSDSSGAIVTFFGNVRAFDHGKEISTLTYEIHPQTNKTLMDVVKEVTDRHKVAKVFVAHRYGEIPIGESAFIVAVSAPHRAEAFEACTELVDEVKARIPIWKHQVFTDGSDEWVNCA